MNNKNTAADAKQSIGAAFLETFKNNMRQYTMIAILLIIWIIFTVFTDGIFITPRNLSTLFLQMCTTAILTGGMLLVIVAGHIDLSVGSVCGTLGALTAYLMKYQGFNPLIAITISLIAGFIVGSWHGYWVAYRGIPAFIVTLASQMAFKGITLLITNGQTIGQLPPLFKAIGQDYIPNLFSASGFHGSSLIIFVLSLVLFIVVDIHKRNKRRSNGFKVLPLPLEIAKIVVISICMSFVGYVLSSYMGIPYAILILAIVVAIFSVVTTRTPFGRHVYATGGNLEAAKLSGVNTRKTLLLIFMIMGTLSGLASVVFTSRLNAATTAAGVGWELDAIAACFIGGTSTTGGIGTVSGALIGALVMASLDNGMSLMNLGIMYQYIIKGAILLLAVWIDVANRKK